MERNRYYEKLLKTVIDHSDSKTWKECVLEWKIINCFIDEDCDSICICGKNGIKYLFEIENTFNGNRLYPIGSKCIKLFERKDLDEITRVTEELYELLKKIEKNNFISFNSKNFSRRLLRYLYDDGAFIPTKYNHYEGYNDYDFMLKMFNQRKPINIYERKKISAIICNSIRPYLYHKLNILSKDEKYKNNSKLYERKNKNHKKKRNRPLEIDRIRY